MALSNNDTNDGSRSLPYTPELDPYTYTYDQTAARRMADQICIDQLNGPSGRNRILKKKGATLRDTLRVLERMVAKQAEIVKPLAQILMTGSQEQNCANIYHFLKTNIPYKLDDPGTEQLRTFARAWFDRRPNKANKGVPGIDCDCYTISSAALAKAMGYTPSYKLAAFRNRNAFSHIYTQVGPYTIDCVMNLPNVEPPKVTDSMVQELASLGAVPQSQGYNFQYMEGFAGVGQVTPVTRALISRQNELLALGAGLAGPDSDLAAEFRKAHFGVLMNGTPDQAAYLGLLSFTRDVTPEGELVLNGDVDPRAVAAIGELYALNADALNGTDRERQFAGAVLKPVIEEVQGLGAVAADWNYMAGLMGALCSKCEAAGLGSFWSKLKKGLASAGKAFMRYNPATFIIRNSFLALVRLNFPGKLAEKLRLGYLSPAEAEVLGLPYDKLQVARDATKKVEKIYDFLGGRISVLKKNVIKGSENKDFYKILKQRPVHGLGIYSYQGAAVCERTMRPTGTDGFDGLGVYNYQGYDLDTNTLRPAKMELDGLGVYNYQGYDLDTNTLRPSKMELDGLGELLFGSYARANAMSDDSMGALGAAPAVLMAKAATIITPVMAILKPVAGALKNVVALAKKIQEVRKRENPLQADKPQQGLAAVEFEGLGKKPGFFNKLYCKIFPNTPKCKAAAAAADAPKVDAGGGIQPQHMPTARTYLTPDPAAEAAAAAAAAGAAAAGAGNKEEKDETTTSKFPLTTALYIGGGVILVFGIGYLVFNQSKSKK